MNGSPDARAAVASYRFAGGIPQSGTSRGAPFRDGSSPGELVLLVIVLSCLDLLPDPLISSVWSSSCHRVLISASN